MPGQDRISGDAYEGLWPAYRQLSEGRDPGATWRAFVESARFRTELTNIAARLLRERRLPASQLGDVTHDAMLLLELRLRRRPTLGFEPAKGEGHFLGWMRAVIRSHCCQVLRARRRPERAAEFNDEQMTSFAPAAGRIEELDEAIGNLPAELREAVTAYRQLGSVTLVAKSLDLQYLRAWRRLQASFALLRAQCTSSEHSSRLTDSANIQRKW